uniref:MAD2L1 binding protein n=1 Tax=Malurus cyaneus samueli TaxID=2593467 RepID=A0A8C5TIH7_9PASS
MGRQAQCFQTRHSLHASPTPPLRGSAKPFPPPDTGAGRTAGGGAEAGGADSCGPPRTVLQEAAVSPGSASAGQPRHRGGGPGPFDHGPSPRRRGLHEGPASRRAHQSRLLLLRGTSPLCRSQALAGPERGGGMRPHRSRPMPGSPAVAVAFPGAVCRGSGYRFACELLKHVLHQRNQLPLPYEQLSYFCRRKPLSLGLASRKCQQMLTELEGLFQHLEVMFSLTLVPRVLFLLGGNVMNPKELYELNLEEFCEGTAEESLQTAPCVRQLFHRLFVADVFSELKALPVTGTLVLVQGHRDCGVEWFRPKLNYKVPTRGRKLIVKLSCDGDLQLSASPPQHMAPAWEDYVWFQAPVTLKGFSE